MQSRISEFIVIFFFHSVFMFYFFLVFIVCLMYMYCNIKQRCSSYIEKNFFRETVNALIDIKKIQHLHAYSTIPIQMNICWSCYILLVFCLYLFFQFFRLCLLLYVVRSVILWILVPYCNFVFLKYAKLR